MATVEMYKRKSGFCPYCDRAERLLRENGCDSINYIYVDEDPSKLEEMVNRSSMRSMPQVFINGQHIGGADALSELAASGELDRLLSLD
ncbi:glutaredoxin domain-containing protein [Candidatus Ichthyocystis hellenicum]|uniref:glutaredoxin domain-containing protein n=1 Tax=Candidatus Ichthyocystis hellenicum TaxID=1561003 RepID=UPI000AB76D61|nr:glutaredoxin domain-containing protein [Candidatus Ichthyocystis hellenicum]